MERLIHGDCVSVMDELISDGVTVDLTVTSPPYDNLRSYNRNNEMWNEKVWKGCIERLYGITSEGGVVVWIVGDATIKGSETGTSFKQALWAKECGFNLHDTMIWNKEFIVPKPSNRYENSMEYMFIFSKGKPRCVNLIKDKRNKGYGRKITGNKKNKEGIAIKLHGSYAGKTVAEFGTRHNVWLQDTTRGKKNYSHPAPFPVQLAKDHIMSWSNEGDVVLDCFMGSGTTGIACRDLNRNFIGIELEDEYCKIARMRLEGAWQ